VPFNTSNDVPSREQFTKNQNTSIEFFDGTPYEFLPRMEFLLRTQRVSGINKRSLP
jgi:hypothetical protein